VAAGLGLIVIMFLPEISAPEQAWYCTALNCGICELESAINP